METIEKKIIVDSSRLYHSDSAIVDATKELNPEDFVGKQPIGKITIVNAEPTLVNKLAEEAAIRNFPTDHYPERAVIKAAGSRQNIF